MKLPPLSDETRNQVQAVAKQVASVLDNLPGWVAKIAPLQAEAATIEAETDQLRASGKHDRQTVLALQAAPGQIEQIGAKIEEVQGEVRKMCRQSAAFVRGASAVIFETCWAPLSHALAAEINGAAVGALAPFGVAEGRATLNGNDLKEVPAVQSLMAFVRRGENLGWDPYNHREFVPAPETVLHAARELKGTLDAILEGRDVFTFTPSA